MCGVYVCVCLCVCVVCVCVFVRVCVCVCVCVCVWFSNFHLIALQATSRVHNFLIEESESEPVPIATDDLPAVQVPDIDEQVCCKYF